MTQMIEYAMVSPAVLACEVERAVPMAVCTFHDCGEEFFEFCVCGWLPLTADDLAKVERVLAPYV